ncbi:MAG: alpha/beta hydrolase [Cellvibrionaceae bacterium]|nr:alpha/beta hydrolase [Cellvibrionaceae bacterium]
MASLLYIHGFLSSPLSAKAQLVKQWLHQQRPDIDFLCPQLSPYPDDCYQCLTALIARTPGSIYLMGSSMGGFWATCLAERYDLPAVLINPAVDVLELMPAYMDQTLKNYHHQATYWLTASHLQQLSRYAAASVLRKSNYWLVVQTGDRVLDYQRALEKYRQCKHTVEPGGDHSFQGFERYIEPAIDFFEKTSKY